MSITVRQFLEKNKTEIYSVTSDFTVFDAIKLMSDKDINSLLVIDNDELVGIFSEKDYTRKVVLKDRSSKTTTVQEIMTEKVLYVSPETNIDECMVLMSKHHIRHLPVIDNGKILGVVSVMDVLKNIITEKEFIIEQLEQYIAGNA